MSYRVRYILEKRLLDVVYVWYVSMNKIFMNRINNFSLLLKITCCTYLCIPTSAKFLFHGS